MKYMFSRQTALNVTMGIMFGNLKNPYASMS